MEAKDTVMSQIQRDNIFFRGIGTLEGVCKLQAEISFKAGEQIGIAKGVMLKTRDLTLLTEAEVAELNAQAKSFYDKAKQEGIEEVVECMTNDFKFAPPEGSYHYELWQAKLKEWGL